MNRTIPMIIVTLMGLENPALASSPCPPGFAQLQNSDTCVRISGRVRAEAITGSPRSRVSDSVTTYASGRVRMEVRKKTEYGPFRAVVAVDGIGH